MTYAINQHQLLLTSQMVNNILTLGPFPCEPIFAYNPLNLFLGWVIANYNEQNGLSEWKFLNIYKLFLHICWMS